MYERVGISLVEVYERVRKSVTSVCKKNQKGWKMYFMAVKKSRKQVLVSDLFIFKRRCIYRDTETKVILSEFTCKIVFTKKKPVASGCIRRLSWLSLVENIGVLNLVPRSHSVLREIWYDDQVAAQPRWGWGTTYNGIYSRGGSARKGYLF